MATRPKILVIGAGPAGLSAGVHLLEAAGDDLDVEIVTMGHHLGGKAKTWRDQEGYVVEHGYHAMFGFYEEMRGLARRAGVDLENSLASNEGIMPMYDPRNGQRYSFTFARNGLVMLARMASFPGTTAHERANVARAFLSMAKARLLRGDPEELDNICYRAHFLQHGGARRFVDHPWFRHTVELMYNAPYEVSAYIIEKAVELSGHCYYDALAHNPRGGWSELFWDPIARYFESLGGRIQHYQKLVHLEHQGGRLRALHFATPDNEGFHRSGTQEWPVEVPTVASTRRRRDDFDAVICTLPAACFVELNDGDSMWQQPFFGNMRKLRSVTSLSLQLWLEDAVPSELASTLAGLPLPLGYVMDNKHKAPEFAADDRYKAALIWTGQEAGFEDHTDAQLIENARAALAKVPGMAGTDRSRVVHAAMHRNRANHQRYLLTEPGTLKFRPTVKSPMGGLYFAGDWVRNEIEIPSMEGAIRCGKVAAESALEWV